uniref:Uncharacterized protein n=1 Tax=Steinernema glaseri TaxID=37863 RepID=A0A1I7YWV0_9BILA
MFAPLVIRAIHAVASLKNAKATIESDPSFSSLIMTVVSPSPPTFPKKIGKNTYNALLFFLALFLAIAIGIAGIKAIDAIGTYEASPKPCDLNAYLDKAHLLHVRYTWFFHDSLSRSMRNGERSTWRKPASRRLEELIEKAQASQKDLSESEDDEYRNNLALRQVYFALAEKRTHDDVIAAIERYIKSINIDRVFVMQKFLAEYLASPPENAEERLNGSRVPFDLKIAQLKEDVPIAQLKEDVPVEYHQFIDRYWKDLKRSTIPGLKEDCLPEDDNARDKCPVVEI